MFLFPFGGVMCPFSGFGTSQTNERTWGWGFGTTKWFLIPAAPLFFFFNAGFHRTRNLEFSFYPTSIKWSVPFHEKFLGLEVWGGWGFVPILWKFMFEPFRCFFFSGIILPSYTGIFINRYKDPYKPTRILESKSVFFFVAQLYRDIQRQDVMWWVTG